jgi:hypothetical protein
MIERHGIYSSISSPVGTRKPERKDRVKVLLAYILVSVTEMWP